MLVNRSLLAAVLVTLIATASALAAPAPIKLSGTVGPGFTIGLVNAKGQKVKTLKQGRYTFVVTDKGGSHNFELEKSGGKFERAITAVGFTGKRSVTMTLTRGKWEFYCEPHKRSMHGDFTVT
jgi:plastocyanin